jgi:hypothetical protein
VVASLCDSPLAVERAAAEIVAERLARRHSGA